MLAHPTHAFILFCKHFTLSHCFCRPVNPRRAGGVWTPPHVFRSYLKSGGAERRRFWHIIYLHIVCWEVPRINRFAKVMFFCYYLLLFVDICLMHLCGIHLFYLTSDKTFIGHASNTTFIMLYLSVWGRGKIYVAPSSAFWGGVLPECPPPDPPGGERPPQPFRVWAMCHSKR